MKKIYFVLVLSFSFISNTFAQTSHTISSGSYYYTPSNISINIGDTVTWINDGGLHNVNFNVSVITGISFGNPESFASSPTTGPTLYTHVFTIPGSYSYDCSVGAHAQSGMIGTVIVNAASSLENLSFSNRTISKTYNLLGKISPKKSNGLIILRYSDGSTEKKIILK